MDLMNKELKIAGDGVKMFKEKKSARESFICGACGQLGHMRTNKNCPKFGEDLETHLETPDMEKASGKSTSPNPSSQSQPKALTKKFIPKSATKIALVEASQGENIGLNSKIVPFKFKCGPTDKLPDKLALGVALSSDRFVTSDPETGKSSVKVNKIIISNKVKAEDKLVESRKVPILIRPPSDRDKTPVESDRGQVESHKPSVAKRPLAETEREQPHKKIIFKRPKEIIDVDQMSQDGGIDIDHKKTKRIVELSSFEKHRKQENVHLVDQASKKKAKNDWRRREEQERQRNEERQREERARSLREEEMRMFEEKNRLAEIRRYEAVIKREREEERQKEKKKKKKKMPEIRDDYIEDPRKRRLEKRMSEADLSAKRRPIVELGRYGSDSAPTAKRRRLGLGEVGLSNILMKIVKRLRERNDVSYLFLKPVSKKEAPDYLEIIERPMDLSTIREKVRKMEYKRRQQFRFDVWQIAYNAHKYNDGRNPSIPPLADQLLELCDYMLNERDDSLTQAEAGIEPREI